MLSYLLHFSSPQAARNLVASYAATLAPSSYVVISVIRADREGADESFGGYSKLVTRVYNYAPAVFAAFSAPGTGPAGRRRRPPVAPGLG